MGLVTWWKEARAVGRIERDISAALGAYPSPLPADGRTEREKGEIAALRFGLSVWTVDRRRPDDVMLHSTVGTPRGFGEHSGLLNSPEYQAGVVHGQTIVTEIVAHSGFKSRMGSVDPAAEETRADWLELAIDRPMVPFADRLHGGLPRPSPEQP